MCSPAAIPYIVMAVAAAAESYSQYEQGKFQEGVAKYNARQSENEAVRLRNKGTEEENKLRRNTAEIISNQRAAAAASGVDVDSGSVLQLQEDSALLGEVDALRLRQNFEDQAVSLEDQADLSRAQGKNARKQGKMSLITGGLMAASYGAQAQGAGAGAAPPSVVDPTTGAIMSPNIQGQSVSPSWYNSNSSAWLSSRSTK